MAINCIIVMVSIIGLQTVSGQVMIVPFTSSMPFNPMTRNGGFDNFMGVHGSNYRTPRGESIFTAIGYDKLDQGSQMRVTIRERSPNFPGAMSPYSDGWDTPSTWYVHGTFLNSDVLNKAGTYYLVVTENGRTRDGCDPASLGRVIRGRGSQRFDKSHQPAGVMPDKLLMTSTGTTVFASKLEGVSRSQLAGAGIAACQFVSNGYCSGIIQFCGTISKDNLPAMEVPTADASVSKTHFASSLLNTQLDTSADIDGLFAGTSQGTNDFLLF